MAQGDSASNKTQAHFVSTLEEICETLEWKKTPASTKRTEKTPETVQDADIDSYLNRFAVLTVEEPQETADKPAVSKQTVKVELIETDGTDEKEDHLSLRFFKAYCSFQDLHQMRAFISQTWSEYRDGKIDLMNASVVTDTALQCARDITDELLESWPEVQSEHQRLQELLYKVACAVRGEDEAPSFEVGLPYSKNMSEVVDWCYLPMSILLNSFAAVLEDNPLPIMTKGYFGIYDPKANRQRMSSSQRFNEDKIILLELLPEFCAMNMLQGAVQKPTQDEITTGLIEFTRTRKVTIWLSFATQIFLDIHHTMRSSRIGAFGDLRMTGLRIKRTIEDFWKLSETHPKPKFWPKEGDQEVKGIHEAIEAWIVNDSFLQVREALQAAAGKQNMEHSYFFW